MPSVHRASKQSPVPVVSSPTRKPKAEIQKAARAPSRAPKKPAPSEPHKVVSPVKPKSKAAPKKAPVKTPSKGKPEAGPKKGEIVAFSEGALHNPLAMWFKVKDVTFHRASGETGKIDWLCAAPEALTAAQGNPLKVAYTSTGTYQPRPTGTVIELPALLQS